MREREPPPAYVGNERLKSVSRTLLQLGSALFEEALVKSYAAATVSVETVGWFLISFAAMWSGWLILALLEPEK